MLLCTHEGPLWDVPFVVHTPYIKLLFEKFFRDSLIAVREKPSHLSEVTLAERKWGRCHLFSTLESIANLHL
ncbi:hypothetical protein XELAEV_18029218mg [Xenopus laevis]|uniref:Uncharacterized protein n=1 Tax=Xenopus laevis TaxID=8355 RepID=A0A974CR79_XENLA|nr:hypothetical protein XELAEV_18029218mg [Xenopus laevis]